MEYNLIICGGTFDRLHAGHKAFLRFAFLKAQKVIIGLTSEVYVENHKSNQHILSFEERKKQLEEFLQKSQYLERAKIVAIDSRFDQTQIPDTNSTALLVSEETYQTGIEINKERVENNLAPLKLLIFPMVKSDVGKISSSKIREGIIDRNGIFLPDKDLLQKTLLLSKSLRSQLREPFGFLVENDIPSQYLQNPQQIVTVGDVTTERFHKLGIEQKLSVVDFQVERVKTHKTLQELGFSGSENIVSLENAAGQLSQDIWKKLLGAMKNLQSAGSEIIIVDGEEDLLVIPLILMLPLGFTLFYGQPKKGVVMVDITEKIKHQTFSILKQFVS